MKNKIILAAITIIIIVLGLFLINKLINNKSNKNIVINYNYSLNEAEEIQNILTIMETYEKGKYMDYEKISDKSSIMIREEYISKKFYDDLIIISKNKKIDFLERIIINVNINKVYNKLKENKNVNQSEIEKLYENEVENFLNYRNEYAEKILKKYLKEDELKALEGINKLGERKYTDGISENDNKITEVWLKLYKDDKVKIEEKYFIEIQLVELFMHYNRNENEEMTKKLHEALGDKVRLEQKI